MLFEVAGLIFCNKVVKSAGEERKIAIVVVGNGVC